MNRARSEEEGKKRETGKTEARRLMERKAGQLNRNLSHELKQSLPAQKRMMLKKSFSALRESVHSGHLKILKKKKNRFSATELATHPRWLYQNPEIVFSTVWIKRANCHLSKNITRLL